MEHSQSLMGLGITLLSNGLNSPASIGKVAFQRHRQAFRLGGIADRLGGQQPIRSDYCDTSDDFPGIAISRIDPSTERAATISLCS